MSNATDSVNINQNSMKKFHFAIAYYRAKMEKIKL